MLVLSRFVEEKIMLGDNITIQVVEIRGDKVRLGIEAPKDVPIHREEVYAAIQRERRTFDPRLEEFRRAHPTLGLTAPGTDYGYFEWGPLRIISSGTSRETGWEHVSVSCANRCPTWEEMHRVKELFWLDSETVLQIHPPSSEYINHMSYCLHLWRQIGVNHPLPPKSCV